MDDPKEVHHCSWLICVLTLLFVPFLFLSFLRVIYLFVCLWVKKLVGLFCRVLSLDFADCHPEVGFNIFLILCIFCKLLVRSTDLIRFSTEFWGTRLHHGWWYVSERRYVRMFSCLSLFGG